MPGNFTVGRSELSNQPEKITAFGVRADLADTHELQLLQYAQRWSIPDPAVDQRRLRLDLIAAVTTAFPASVA
jgi:hypothetical protein